MVVIVVADAICLTCRPCSLDALIHCMFADGSEIFHLLHIGCISRRVVQHFCIRLSACIGRLANGRSLADLLALRGSCSLQPLADPPTSRPPNSTTLIPASEEVAWLLFRDFN